MRAQGRFRASWILLTAALLACSGCGPDDNTADATGPDGSGGFEVSTITGSNSYGGGFSAGILVVSHATGSVNVCWKTCTKIGTFEPTGPHALTLTNAGNLSVYVTNTATGHVVYCEVESDGFVTKFLGGHCKEIGTAK